MPILIGLPERELFPINRIKEDVAETLRMSFKQRLHLFEHSLQKNLQKSRVLFLRADNRATDWIRKLRERSDKRKSEHEAHWKDLRFTFPIKKTKAK
ncbi:MAG: hypothetical protein PHW52_05320 [Candidatus Pacebacteria bacterium]|nr:hypothetical protein [Candidatus Paceibacterota bacterium]